MAANLDDVGIQSSGLALLESIDYSKKLEEAVIMDSDSSFGDAEAFNPTIDWSLKGRGDISGTLLVLSTKQDESNTDFNGWEASGKYYPNAVPIP
jgi:pyridoxal/pyridoxine/pyridoxamine kinase